MAKRKEIKVFAREWRNQLGFTLEKVAGRAGMSVSYLSDLERGSGNKRWNTDQIVALAMALGLEDPNDLFRHPARQDPLLTLINGLSNEQRETAERVIAALQQKTGTDN